MIDVMFDLLFLGIGLIGGGLLTFLFHYFICPAMHDPEYQAALENIRNNEGRVCAEYETCQHPGCHSSYSAWAIADSALTGMPLGQAKA